MALTLAKRPEVVRLGGAYEERYAYTDAAAINPGDLIRLSTAGSIEVATPVSCHGMALETGTTGGDVLPVLMFATDTVVKLSTEDGDKPTDFEKGVAYILEVGSNEFALVDTTTNGIAIVVDYADTAQPWSDATSSFSDPSTALGGSVLVRFTAACLDDADAA